MLLSKVLNKLSYKLSACLIAICLVFSGQVLARSYDDVIASGHLIIGVYRDFPPYSYLVDDEPSGVDIELGKAIAKAFKLEFRLHWITPDESLGDDLRNNVWKGHYLDKDTEHPLSLKKLADVMMRVPYDREFAYRQDPQTGEGENEQVVMFGPYQRESWRVAYDAQKMDAVKTMAVFQYYPIGVEIDSLPDFYLSSGFQGRMRKNVHHFSTARMAFTAMQDGQVNAVMAMRSEIDNLLFTANDARFQVAENGFPSIGKQKWDVGMAVKSSYRQLSYAVDDVVAGMVRSGEMAALFATYGITYELPELYQDTQ
ncbi:substrate-binding periplasmic protein [Neptunomonas antarctica]|uniref:Amino acid ABC transporter substrate-binding protein, PAAT family n=1 Tax=Neptunomonas antarctica TaxID=619304 RepID=A0A1N7IWF9_9GAMM|nr:ABC transporter substrate-binding protein [Neptunomonas antarctica]SIS41331.1 amino acid ABC transporter substrate-binding protein, PAAT family [Neptunomonas antarctica]